MVRLTSPGNRPRSSVVWLVWPVAGLVAAGPVVRWVVFPGPPSDSLLETLALAGWALLPVPFALVAALIASRQPRNPIGWLLFMPALVTVLDLLFLLFVSVPGADPGSPPAGSAAVLFLIWAANYSWMGLIFPVFHLLLVFPTGELLSDRWRWLVRLEWLMIGFLLLTGALAEDFSLPDGTWTLSNPIGFIPGTFFGPLFSLAWSVGLLALVCGGGVGIVLRYRRAGAAERQQLKWLLLAVALFATTYVSVTLNSASGDALVPLLDLVFALSIWVIPISIGIAVLRYRLFEIDRLLSRTVTYLVVVGLLGLTYAGLVVAIRTLAPVEGDLRVALSTLVVALGFLPLLRRVQRGVDRRFFRSRYDAGVVVARVAEDLRASLDLAEVTARAKATVSDVFNPDAVSIWLSEDS